MRAKSFFLLLMALGCGLVASIGITQVMAKRDAEPPAQAGDTEVIFLAMKDIGISDPITAQNVKREERPKAFVPAGAMLNWEDVENRRPKVPIMAGCPILESQLRGKGSADAGPDGLIPKGYLVVPVKVDSSTGGVGIIRPGARVDVLAYIKADSGKIVPRNMTRTVLQDVKVFAVNDIWDAASGAEEKSMMAKTISLLVTPEQAEVLTMASEMGTIRLAMRGPDDSERRNLRGTEARELIGAALGGMEPGREPTLPQRVEPQEKGGDVLSFLKELGGKKEQTAKVETPPPPPPKEAPPPEPKKVYFTVRVLTGSQVTETVLESPAQEGTGDNAGDTPSRWRVNRTSSHPAAADRAEPPPPARSPGFTAPEPRPASGEKKPGANEQDKERARPTGK